MYVPAALAGVLLPYAFAPSSRQRQPAMIHGATIAHALLAAAMSLAGLKASFAFALWAASGVLSLLIPKQVTAIS